MSARSFPLNAEGHITPRNRCLTTRTRFASLSTRSRFTRLVQSSYGSIKRPAGMERDPHRYRDRLPPLRTAARAGRFQLAPGATGYVPGPLTGPVQSIVKTVRFQLFPAKF